MVIKLIYYYLVLISYIECKQHSKIGDYSDIQTKDCGLRQFNHNAIEEGVSSRIVNGLNASLGEFPWMVLIYSQTMSGSEVIIEHYCGGALISNRYVVTAANCFILDELKTDQTVGIAGTVSRIDDTYFSVVKNITIHERFNRSDHLGRYYDIALVELSDDDLRPQLYDENDSKKFIKNTVCLPEKGVTNSEEERAIFSAFGGINVNYTPFEAPNHFLKKAEYSIADSSKCDSRQICGHESVHPSCWGDTGSPLVQFVGERAVLIGIFTTVGNESKGCAQNWQYFTRVSYFIDWIIDRIRIAKEITESEVRNSNPKPWKPSLIAVLILSILLVSGSLCLTIYCLTLKTDSEISPEKSKPLQKSKKTPNENSKQIVNK